jgi:3-methyladenine DNA glycosylase/8-oxoguanine DNA glycosylase
LADKAKQGTIPHSSELDAISDDDLVARLTKIHGIGPWTVHMLLIFTLGRPDVFPIGDFAIRKAICQLYRAGEPIAPSEMLTIAEKWSPYRSLASWYLWRSLDLPNVVSPVSSPKKPGVKT